MATVRIKETRRAGAGFAGGWQESRVRDVEEAEVPAGAETVDKSTNKPHDWTRDEPDTKPAGPAGAIDQVVTPPASGGG